MEKSEIIYNEEAEQAVLGAMMEDERVIPEVVRILNGNKEVFYQKASGLVLSTDTASGIVLSSSIIAPNTAISDSSS